MKETLKIMRFGIKVIKVLDHYVPIDALIKTG